MVITLIAFCILGGFLLGDTILSWRILIREWNGVSVADLPKPLSGKTFMALALIHVSLWMLGAHQAFAANG